jgi:hypothetical protein
MSEFFCLVGNVPFESLNLIHRLPLLSPAAAAAAAAAATTPAAAHLSHDA